MKQNYSKNTCKTIFFYFPFGYNPLCNMNKTLLRWMLESKREKKNFLFYI